MRSDDSARAVTLPGSPETIVPGTARRVTEPAAARVDLLTH